MPVLSNHRQLWSANEIAELNSMVARRIHRKQIAAQLGRTEAAIDAKLNQLHGRRPTREALKRQQRRRSGASAFLS
jgi:hypothetical protein